MTIKIPTTICNLDAVDTIQSRVDQARAATMALLLHYTEQPQATMAHLLTAPLMCSALGAIETLLDQACTASDALSINGEAR